MSELTDNLETLIQKAALDGALTQDAVAQFHALVEQQKASKIALDDYHKLTDQHNATIEALTKRCDAAETCAQDWAGREQDLMDREEKCLRLEMEAEYQGKRVSDHQEMVRLIFRNSVLKQGVMTPLAGLKADQYGSSHAPFAQKDDVESEET